MYENGSSDSIFIFKNKEYHYNTIPINNLSERCVEVPIGLMFLFAHRGERVLEVGNVIGQYENEISVAVGLSERVVLDKFEKGPGVLNEDLLTYDRDGEFDAILSISTVEHVGMGSDPSGTYGEPMARDITYPLRAIEKIYRLLAPNGKALITVPAGQLTDGGWYIQFSQLYLDLLHTTFGVPRDALEVSILDKISADWSFPNPSQVWEESTWAKITERQYGCPYPNATAIAVIELTKIGTHLGKVVPLGRSLPLVVSSPPLIGQVYFSNFRLGAPFTAEGWFVSTGRSLIWYGPYISVEEGKFSWDMVLEVDADFANLYSDVCTKQGTVTILSKHIQATGRREITISDEFWIRGDCNDLEIRLFNLGELPIRVRPTLLRLTKIDTQLTSD